MKPLALQSFLIPPLGMGAKYLSDNLVVSYSPFLNAKKINNKWFMRLRKSRVYRDWSKSIAGVGRSREGGGS